MFFSIKKLKFHCIIFDSFNIFAQTIDCGYTEAVLTSTHNLCFGTKIINIGIPCKCHFCYMNVGYKGVNIIWTCFHDVG